MQIRVLRSASLFLTIALLLSGCAAQSTIVSGAAISATTVSTTAVPALPTATATAVATPTPTALPTVAATAEPRIPPDVQIAGIDVGGLRPQEAVARLQGDLQKLYAPLLLQAGTLTSTLDPGAVGLKIPFEGMVAEASAASSGARLPLQASYDEARVQAALQAIAGQVVISPTFDVIVASKPISRSFTVAPGQRLDIDDGTQRVGTSLRTVDGARAISLTVVTDTTSIRPPSEQLQEQMEQAASNWKGVVGMYVYDLRQDTVVAQINPDTVFSGASVMKVPIMLHSYIKLNQFDAKQERWLRQMITDSDNWSANQLLAASVGGSGVLAALKGAEEMTTMLKDLGLEHTYQYSPYQSQDFLLKRSIPIKSGPVREGSPPYTAADRRLRTTPAEMSTIFVLIEQCSQGKGKLLDMFPTQLSAARCQEMVDRLRLNGDRKRIVSGLPPGTDVAHKSGWIDDMQADIGIIHSSGGDFVLAVYVYQQKNFADSSVATPAIGQLARLVYTYYNPVVTP